jgi:hypothetical protein
MAAYQASGYVCLYAPGAITCRAPNAADYILWAYLSCDNASKLLSPLRADAVLHT